MRSYIVNYWHEIFEAIKRKPVRAILTGIGITWGIFILVVLIGLGSGFEKGVYNLFKGFSLSSNYVYALQTTMPYRNNPTGKLLYFTEDDIKMLDHNIPQILVISPQVGKWELCTSDNGIGRFEIRGVYPCYFEIKLLEMDLGRSLNQLDYHESRKVVLIGKNVSDMLFEHLNPLGQMIQIKGENYKIVGVIQSSITSVQEERVIYLPYTTYINGIENTKRINSVFFSTMPDSNIKEVRKRLCSFMSRKYEFDPRDEKAFYFECMEDQVKAFTDFFKSLKKFLWILGLSTLLSGMIGIGNIMFASSKERTREIGIRLSVGAQPKEIRNMILGESIFLTTFFGVLGIILGWFVLKLIGMFIDEQIIIMEKPGIDMLSTVSAVLILIISGTIAGAKPAIYASKLNPVETLKNEN